MTDTWMIIPASALKLMFVTVVMYAVLLVLARVFGHRCLAGTSPHDIGCIVAVGAVPGRTALLGVPTLGSAVIALVTFFVLQRLLGFAQRTRLPGGLLRRKPILLIAGSA